MNKVKEIRTKLGMSQDSFAAKLGVAPYSVRRWEAGKNDPSPMAEKLIEELFGADVAKQPNAPDLKSGGIKPLMVQDHPSALKTEGVGYSKDRQLRKG